MSCVVRWSVSCLGTDPDPLRFLLLGYVRDCRSISRSLNLATKDEPFWKALRSATGNEMAAA